MIEWLIDHNKLFRCYIKAFEKFEKLYSKNNLDSTSHK